MNNREKAEVLRNCASMLKNGTKYMKEEHEKQFQEAYEEAIKALEQSEWIPVSSGNFPDEHQKCLFWDEDLELGYGSFFTTSRGIKCFWDYERGSDAKNVIAWRPLPEPYKEEEK